MKKILTLILLFTLSLFGASFDCAKATTKVEKMICADPELSKLDENLSKTFKEAMNTTKDKEQLKKEQFAWMKERDRCNDDIDCLINTYRDRLSVFEHLYKLYQKPPIPLSKVPYKLVVSKNDELCKPLLELYNRDIQKVQKIDYNNHPEFNWLHWKDYVIKSDDTQLIGGAFFDLNGDNKEEFVFGWYAYIRDFPTENFMIFDNNVSNFFKHSPNFTDKWPQSIYDFDNLGNSEPKSIGSIDYDLLAQGLNHLPPYIVKIIKNEKQDKEEWKRQYPASFIKIGWKPIWQKNEIRFLKWKDGKVYLVFEGSQRFRDRNQFNLIGRVNQDFSYDAQCLFYKNNK